jgi:hypothetical protein
MIISEALIIGRMIPPETSTVRRRKLIHLKFYGSKKKCSKRIAKNGKGS